MTSLLEIGLAAGMVLLFGILLAREYASRRALSRVKGELADAQAHLAETAKIAAVGQLVSGIARELNNPLQGVIGNTELMLAEAPAGQAEALEQIRNSASRAAGIVRNLMAVAGVEPTSRGWHDLNAIIDRAIDTRREHLEFEGISVRTRRVDRLPLVYVDAKHLERAILQLLINAEDATRRRPDSRAADHFAEVVISTERRASPDDRLVMEVIDHGPGLAADNLPHLFASTLPGDPRVQAGHGLLVAANIVAEHGGRMRAENHPEGGSRFVIELPVGGGRLDVPTLGRPTPRALVPSPGRVLLVDDDDSDAASVRKMLEQLGVQVERTALSRRALVMLERTDFDLIVTDLVLPELGGQELYMRAVLLRPELRRQFVFMTDDVRDSATREFLDGTGCPVFERPVNEAEFATAVTMLVGRQVVGPHKS